MQACARAHIPVPGSAEDLWSDARVKSGNGVMQGKGAQPTSPRHPKPPLLAEEFLRKDLTSPYFRHVTKTDVASKSDKSYFRSACTSALRMEPPREGQAGHLGFDETNTTISGDVQTAPTSSERTRWMNLWSPVKSETKAEAKKRIMLPVSTGHSLWFIA